MDKDIKAKWIAKLRDPEAVQAEGYLGFTDGGRCCLGVLCDIAVENGVIPSPTPSEVGVLMYASTTSSLPGDVVAWADLPTIDPSVESDTRMKELPLSVWNDQEHMSFREIADMIEKNL